MNRMEFELYVRTIEKRLFEGSIDRALRRLRNKMFNNKPRRTRGSATVTGIRAGA